MMKTLLPVVLCIIALFVKPIESGLTEDLLKFVVEKIGFGLVTVNAIPEAKLDTMGIIRHYGYPAEVHTTMTEDGYFLELHRISGGRNNTVIADRPPVLLVHGLASSSGVFVINGIENSLGFLLADEGFDVWLANLRGNRYSRRHMSISPEFSKFWEFSLDEHALNDLPAIIDYILQLTNQKHLTFIGHCVGGRLPLMLLSEKEEYNSKLKQVILLAPVVYTEYSKSISRLIPIHQRILKPLIIGLGGTEELLRYTDIKRDILNVLDSNDLGHVLLHSVLSVFNGYTDVASDNMIAYVQHSAVGTSWNAVTHFGQHLGEERLRKYDLGANGNIIKYGQSEPPEYDVSKVSAQMSLFWSNLDLNTDSRGMKTLEGKLKNVIAFEEVTKPEWIHSDFLIGKNAKLHMYEKLVEIIKNSK